MKNKNWIYYGTMGIVGVGIGFVLVGAYLIVGYIISELFNYTLVPQGLKPITSLQGSALFLLKNLFWDTRVTYEPGSKNKSKLNEADDFNVYRMKGNA